eukprot:scaffold10851_cov129-Cyclotella_meneghiniana.AAC.5
MKCSQFSASLTATHWGPQLDRNNTSLHKRVHVGLDCGGPILMIPSTQYLSYTADNDILSILCQ